MDRSPGASLWTRRRVLKVGVAIAVGGGTALAAVIAAFEQRSPTAASTAPPSPGPGPVGHRYRSRPDISPPFVAIAAGSAAAPGAATTASGLVFLTPNNGQGAGRLIVDTTGEPVWFGPAVDRLVTDFRVLQYAGGPILAWWEGTVSGAGIGSGEHVLADPSYGELYRIPAASGRASDLHELQLTSAGTALLFADAPVSAERFGPGSPPPWQVLDCAIQEIDIWTGRLVWEWHAVDHTSPAESAVPAPSAAGEVYDYLHANSIEVDHDGQLLMSARNTSTVYKIDRQTGEVLWRLGGKRSDFRMGPGTTFAFQHDARRREDGTITIFDDQVPPTPARAIVLEVDEDAMTASLVREYRHPRGLAVTSQGNVQTLPSGNLFVGWGATPGFTEFAADGRVVFDATFEASRQSYRDFRFPWVGRPLGSPAVATERQASGGLVVYASWNGATEVASWEVLDRSAAGGATVLASAPRTGFETAIEVSAAVSQLAVRARGPEGEELALSEPVSVA